MTKSRLYFLINEWAKNWKETNLNIEVLKLINQASTDLDLALDHLQKINDGTKRFFLNYPGFTYTCSKIRSSLEMLPSQMYFDLDAGLWDEKQFSYEVCSVCGEEMESDYLCSQHGECEVVKIGKWTPVEKCELIRAIVGHELYKYVVIAI